MNSNNNQAIIQAQSLSVKIKKSLILKDLNFSVKAGEIYALLGGNGAGKSTTLKTLLGFNQPSVGEVLIEGKKVVIIDDVLYSGRSINAALSALQSYGRPEQIELLVLIDRRFSRHLPIQPDYRGRQVDVINNEKVSVHWKENDTKDAVYLTTK